MFIYIIGNELYIKSGKKLFCGTKKIYFKDPNVFQKEI